MPETIRDAGGRRLALCRLLVAIWVPLFLWSHLPGGVVGATVAAGLQLLLLLVFIVVHASLYAGWRGAGLFLLIGYAVGFACEAASINTGVPFGWFVHLAPGPKPLGVPLYVPLAYAFLGWLAWTLAALLCRRHPAEHNDPARWLLPLVAALILTGYDLAYDAIGSAVQGMWVYRTPSGFFGVPLSNFIGWTVTGTIIFVIFSAIEPRLARDRSVATGRRTYWMLPCIVWGTMVIQYPMLSFAAPAGDVLVGGRQLLLADIYEAATIVACLSMLPPALSGLARTLVLPPRGAGQFGSVRPQVPATRAPDDGSNGSAG